MASERIERLAVAPVRLTKALALASMISVIVIILTGAAVRLTGSGLGCSDWPTCSVGHLTPAFSYHPLIEFGNRMVTVIMVILFAVTFLAMVRRRPFRRDLVWLSGLLVLGVVAEAVIGGLVVYSKLNPYLVMVHFLITLSMLVVAVVLVHRASRDYSVGSAHPLVQRSIVRFSYALCMLAAVVVAAGSATTGAAPDTGGAQGQLVAKRIPVSLRDMAELHSSLALVLVGGVLGVAVALHALGVVPRVAKASRVLLFTLVMQAAIGYVQYFTHLPAGVVELHELGIAILTVGFTQFLLSLTHHRAETS